jgi:ABC-type transport system involved in multi-copper enzyme maturation permease subunit
MKTLLRKEIRLLLPAFAGALALAILPVWLLPFDPRNPGATPGFLFWFGAMMLALSSFGREFGLKTLPFILAQPLERARIWWTKAGVLAVCLGLVFDAWLLSCNLCSSLHPARSVPPEELAIAGFFAVVLTAGGLWMTLLLRQVAAAFWLALLMPMAIGVIGSLWVTDRIMVAATCLYAVAAFFLARRQFLRLQDTAWTGGVVSIGRRRAAAGKSALREHRPWAALFLKELQLLQVTLAGMAVLFVAHLGAVVLRKAGADVLGKNTLFALQMFGIVWLFVPLLVGSQSVAEERQFGTFDGLLSLPISRRVQFGVKMLIVLVAGGLLSAALLCACERLADTIGAGAHLEVMGITFQGAGLVEVFLVFLALSLTGFYASTLTRGVVPALGAGGVAALVFWMIWGIGSGWHEAFGWRLWPVMALPALTAAVLWLAYGNFRHVFESGRRWRRNILGLTAVLVLVSGAAAALYHRVWELAMPLEGAHGPARLPAGKPVLFRSSFNGLAVVLPDGRLWEDRVVDESAWFSLGGYHFVPGSNWVDGYANFFETAAIRSDGSLWISEKPRRRWNRQQPLEQSPPLVPFGVETNWQSLEHDLHGRLVLLKRDGTLWRWGTNIYETRVYVGLREVAPLRLGAESDWARILRGYRSIYAWKQDGRAWALREPESNDVQVLRNLEVELAPGTAAIRMPTLDHVQFQSLGSYEIGPQMEIGVCDDGTLRYELPVFDPYLLSQWALYQASGRTWTSPLGLVQIGKDTNWAAVSSGEWQLVALKTDGSIWKWNLDSRPSMRERNHPRPPTELLQDPPERLGTHQDWVALGVVQREIVTLAADGTLWRWPGEIWYGDEWWVGWVAPSRRPAKIENIFGAPE